MRLDEFDLAEAAGVAQPARLVELGVGDVDPDDAPGVPDQHGRAEDVGARAGPEVEHGHAGRELCEVQEVAHACERGDGLGGNGVEQRGRVAQVLRERTPDLEVQAVGLVAGDLAVHALDLGLEAIRVDQGRRVELRQTLGGGQLGFLGGGAGCHWSSSGVGGG